MNPRLNAALMYAQYHCKVFPLKVNSNEEHLSNQWKEKSTLDIKTITEWFTNTDYHVGVSTGDGLIVIEVENKKHSKELMQQYIKQFPNTLIVRTPEDGWHFYYRVNRNIETTFNIYDGIHVYGQYGYVLGAGNQLENCKYLISMNNPIAEANDFVYAFIKGEVKDYQVTWKSAVDMKEMAQVEDNDIISSLLPVGVTLLGAPSKMGKTFLCMQLASAVAQGTKFLGYTCQKRNVYYIALEDPMNLQIKRLKNASFDVSKGYDIELTQAYQTDFDLEEKIKNYIHFNPNLGVVIVDTFEKIRLQNDRTYTIEYKEVTYYHELALKHNISIILVMHTIKNINYGNIISNISGSAGTLAAADGLMVLLRNQMNSNIKMLYVEGKGIPNDIIHMKQDENMTFYRIESDDNNVDVEPDLMDIIHYVIEKGRYSGSCEKLGVEAGITNCNGKHIRSILDRNKHILELYFVRYTILPRASYSRKIELVYYGEDRLNDDANDDMTKK